MEFIFEINATTGNAKFGGILNLEAKTQNIKNLVILARVRDSKHIKSVAHQCIRRIYTYYTVCRKLSQSLAQHFFKAMNVSCLDFLQKSVEFLKKGETYRRL